MTPTEHCRVELKIPKDSRALGAVRGALQHTARHLGLSSNDEERLVSVTKRLLRSAITSISEKQELIVLIQEHPNRVEIVLDCPGNGPDDWNSLQKLPGIDQLERDASGRRTYLKLVKLLPSAMGSPSSAN